MDKTHTHNFHNAQQLSALHHEGNKHITYRYLQTCDCGVWRTKEFINEEDIKVVQK